MINFCANTYLYSTACIPLNITGYNRIRENWVSKTSFELLTLLTILIIYIYIPFFIYKRKKNVDYYNKYILNNYLPCAHCVLFGRVNGSAAGNRGKSAFRKRLRSFYIVVCELQRNILRHYNNKVKTFRTRLYLYKSVRGKTVSSSLEFPYISIYIHTALVVVAYV